jgi:protein gp37
MAKRLQAMGSPNYANGFRLTTHEHQLEVPLNWKKPSFIFVNSMSDLFHEDAPVEFILRVFDTMCHASWHTFQVLTKRSQRLLELAPKLPWPENVWMGVSVESADYTYRIDNLALTGARTKFVSFEPLIGAVGEFNIQALDWVIVGGESGPGARSMEEGWVLQIKNLCIQAEVPFFFKQWGGVNKKKAGRLLENQTWDEMPLVDARQASYSMV